MGIRQPEPFEFRGLSVADQEIRHREPRGVVENEASQFLQMPSEETFDLVSPSLCLRLCPSECA